jgi:hypothetical protein
MTSGRETFDWIGEFFAKLLRESHLCTLRTDAMFGGHLLPEPTDCPCVMEAKHAPVGGL